jgi:hypothetical protein
MDGTFSIDPASAGSYFLDQVLELNGGVVISD